VPLLQCVVTGEREVISAKNFCYYSEIVHVLIIYSRKSPQMAVNLQEVVTHGLTKNKPMTMIFK